MTDGHCEHCGTCAGRPENRAAWPMVHQAPPPPEFPKGLPAAKWQSGHCPACAERARIVAHLKQSVGNLHVVNDIRNGKHLEAIHE